MRLLSGLVDGMIILLPIQFIMMGVFGISLKQGEFFFQILFAIYGLLLGQYFDHTLGKYFSKLVVVDENGRKPSFLYHGIREMAKALYILPIIGFILFIISFGMLVIRRDHKMLHDFVGNTNVCFISDSYFVKDERNGSN